MPYQVPAQRDIKGKDDGRVLREFKVAWPDVSTTLHVALKGRLLGGEPCKTL